MTDRDRDDTQRPRIGMAGSSNGDEPLPSRTRASRPPRASRPSGPPPVDTGPRFDLRFESGRGLLRLARPFAALGGVVETLELSLGHVRFPMDVSRGAIAFRTRRTQLRQLRFRIALRPLRERAALADVALVHLAASPDARGYELALVDDWGTCAFDCRPLTDGSDLAFTVDRLRCIREGPTSTFERLCDQVARLGLELDDERGVFVLRQPVRTLLAHALCPHGWRVPDVRAAPIASIELTGDQLEILASSDLDGLDPHDVLAWESAEVAARALACARRGDLTGAVSALRVASERADRRGDAALGMLGRWQSLFALDGDSYGSAEGEVDGCLELRRALRSGDDAHAAAEAERIARTERVSELAVEALLSTVTSALARHDVRHAFDAVGRALRRQPTDEALLAKRVELAERLHLPAEIVELASRTLAGPLPGRSRAVFANLAGEALTRLEALDDAERCFREALVASPDDPRALEGLGAIDSMRDDGERAVLRFDRAARVYAERGDPSHAAQVAWRAGELLARAGRLDAAERRLERAVAWDPDRVEVVCAFARLRARLGAVDEAAAVFDRLLSLTPERAALDHGLVEAALFHLDAGEPEHAVPFVDRMTRDFPHDERRAPLADRLRRAWAADDVVEVSVVDVSVVEVSVVELSVVESRPVESSVAESQAESRAERRDGALDAPDDSFRGDDTKSPRDDAKSLGRPSSWPPPDPKVVTEIRDATGAADPVGDELARLDAAGDVVAVQRFVAGLVEREALPDQPALLHELARRVDGVVQGAVARRLAERYRRDGKIAEAALALADAGAAEADAATLRAALRMARKAGEHAAARRIVALALRVVGDGPARGSWLERGAELELESDDDDDDDDERS